MNFDTTEVIAIFDVGTSWKRFQLFDTRLNSIHLEEKLIDEIRGDDGELCNNLPLISEWMRASLEKVAGDSLYTIRAVNVAGIDQCLEALADTLTKLVDGLFHDQKPYAGEGILNTAASLLPYLAGTDKPFIMASTGSWCTFINPFDKEPYTDEQLCDGTRFYLDTGSRMLKASRFLLGEIHDTNVIMLDDHFGVTGELYKTIKIRNKKISNIEARRRGRVFFRHGIPEGGADHGADLSRFLTYADAYHQMMYDLVDECLEAYRQVEITGEDTGILYVTGGFARNDSFIRILAARLPEMRVYTSTIEHATALGAAIDVWQEVFNTELPALFLGLKAILLRDDQE